MGESKEIELKCPVCGTEKAVNIPVISYNQKQFGTSKIAIPTGAICEHHFLIFLDRLGEIRGYEKIDISMGAPTEEQMKLSFKPLIRMLGLEGIAHLLHSKIFDYPAFVLLDKDQADLINGVFNRIIPDFYGETDPINLIDEDLFNKKLNEKVDALLIDSDKNIKLKPWSEKIKLEEGIVEKAVEIIDDEEQLILLTQDVRNFLKDVNFTMSFLLSVDETDDESILNELSKQTSLPKNKKDHLNLIKLCIERRAQPGLTSKITGKKRRKKTK